MSETPTGHGDFSDLDKNGDGHISEKKWRWLGALWRQRQPVCNGSKYCWTCCNPVAYVAGKAIYNAVGDTELFGKKSDATTNKPIPLKRLGSGRGTVTMILKLLRNQLQLAKLIQLVLKVKKVLIRNK